MTTKVCEIEMEGSDLIFVSGSVKYDKDLDCFTCHDESLYHDSNAFWSKDKDDLLCVDCFKKLQDKTGYVSVITFH
jgi:hypothetical protein